MKGTFKYSALSFLMLFITLSCDQEDFNKPIVYGEVNLGVNPIENVKNGRVEGLGLENATSVLLTINEADGSSTEYSLSEIDLFQLEGSYISQKLSLPIGEYELTAFLVLDSNQNIIYATPESDSEQAQNVHSALPIQFTIETDEIITLDIEVISTEDLDLEDFGLVGFNITEVEILNFMVYVSQKGNLDNLLEAEIAISSESYSFSQDLASVASNSVSIRDGFSIYDFSIEKEGYLPFNASLTRDSLSKHSSIPWTIELTVDLESSLIASYLFENNIEDESVNLFHGEISGDLVFNSYNGGHAIEIQDDRFNWFFLPYEVCNDLQDFTFSAFLQINVLNKDNNLLSGANSVQANEINFGYNSIEDVKGNGLHGKGWRLIIGGQEYYYAENKIMDDKSWHHVAVVREGNKSRLYIDGDLIGDEISISDKRINLSENGLIIGQDQDCVGGCFQDQQNWAGGIDELNIYNEALDLATIKQLSE